MTQPITTRPSTLLLFTTSQTPLAPRYPHPAKPALLLPPLVHTTLHNALDSETPSWTFSRGGDSAATTVIIPNPKDLGPNGSTGTLSSGPSSVSAKSSHNSLSSSNGAATNPIRQSASPSPVSPTFSDEVKERMDNEITVKFYIVGPGGSDRKHGRSGEPSIIAEQISWIREGLDALEKHKRPKWSFGSGPSPPTSAGPAQSNFDVSSRSHDPARENALPKGKIDTFLLGWKGIDYIGKKTESEAESIPSREDSDTGEERRRQPGCGSAKLASREAAIRDREENGGVYVSEHKKMEMVELWKALGDLVPNAVQLGTLSLPLSLLQLLHSQSVGASPGDSTPAESQAPSQSTIVPPAVKSSSAADGQTTISSMSSSDPPVEQAGSTSRNNASASPDDRALLSELLHSAVGGVTTIPSLSGGNSEFAELESLASKQDARKESGRVRRPRVNSLNTPDCHSLPRGLTDWAKEEGIELWAGGSGIGSDPMPSLHLHNTLAEFVPQFPADLLPEGSKLGKIVPFPAEGDAPPDLGVEVRWILSYTVISRTRNVVKDKGYIISAALL